MKKIILLLSASFLLISCEKDYQPKTFSVEYKVTGWDFQLKDAKYTVTWIKPGNTDNITKVEGKEFSYKFTGYSGDFLYLAADVTKGDWLYAYIIVNFDTVKADTFNGAYPATLFYSLPH